MTKEWQQKLPDFVRRLEEALYRSAATKARGRLCAPLQLRTGWPAARSLGRALRALRCELGRVRAL